MTRRKLKIEAINWPVKGEFRIARGSRTFACVVQLTLTQNDLVARSECVPYQRYAESVSSVIAQIEQHRNAIETDLDRLSLQSLIKPGAARNAIDCLLWDLEAKTSGKNVASLCLMPPLKALNTAYTLSIDTPENMALAAQKACAHNTLKVKLAGDSNDRQRLLCIRDAAADATLIVDANEGWSTANLDANLNACTDAKVSWLEQPLAEQDDDALRGLNTGMILCADESAHVAEDCRRLTDRYQAVNIKLDKTGGLTEAIKMLAAARREGLKVMSGCMLGSSLAMAPALIVAQSCDITDLDGPLLLAQDIAAGLVYEKGQVYPPDPALWGGT